MVKIAKAKKSTHSRGKASKNLRTGKSLTIRKEEDPNAEWEIDVSLNSPEEIYSLEPRITGLNKGLDQGTNIFWDINYIIQSLHDHLMEFRIYRWKND